MACCGKSSAKKPNHDPDMLDSDIVKQLLDFKILLLGAGESGKSTVVKQLKTIHRVEIDQSELKSYATNIHKNTLQMMQVLIEAAENFGYKFDSDKEQIEIVTPFNFESDEKAMPVDVGEAIDVLWKNEVIQKTWARRSEFWFLDAAPYYFTHVNRFIEDDYVPTEEDVIMTRVRTTGISVTEFDDQNLHFSVVDVGGQRNERKKWIHCFDDVKALIFVVNLAGYDQVMFEDPTQNRMQESLTLFKQISNNPIFSVTPIFLFLNKKDLFESMLEETPLTKCFSDYKGSTTNEALDYIQLQFKNQLDGKNHFQGFNISSRFKKDIKYTWDDLKEFLMSDNKKAIAEAKKLGGKK